MNRMIAAIFQRGLLNESDGTSIWNLKPTSSLLLETLQTTLIVHDTLARAPLPSRPAADGVGGPG